MMCVCDVVFQKLFYNLKYHVEVKRKIFSLYISDHDQKHFLIFGSYICASEFSASFYMVGIHVSIPIILRVLMCSYICKD